MKKLLSAFMAALAFVSVGVIGPRPCFAGADNISDRASDTWTLLHKGSSNTAIAVDKNGQLNMPSGIRSVHEHFDTPPAISTIAYMNTTISTTTLKAQATTYTQAAFITQPVYPGALTFAVKMATGVQSSNLITTATVRGVTARGETITETVNGVNDSSFKVTNNAFAKITSISFSALNSIAVTTETATVYLNVGSTGTYGLAGNLSASDDFYKAKAWNVDATSVTVNTTYDTWSYPANVSGLSTTDLWYRDTTSAPVKPR